MTTTTNYGYTVINGSDSPVNIQNDIAPNFTAIDTDLKAVSDSAITDAAHTVTGTVHALVRTDADRNVFYFVATGDMVAGDTFTVDGLSVTARLVNGEALGTGSFKINNTVMCILIGSVLNIMTYNSVTIPTPSAAGVTYDNTGSGLTATDVQNAIDEIETQIKPGSVSVTADGVKTFNQLFAELFVIGDPSKVTKDTRLSTSQGAYYTLRGHSNSHLEFMWCGCSAAGLSIQDLRFETNASNCHFTMSEVNSSSTFTTNEFGNTVPGAGLSYTLEY